MGENQIETNYEAYLNTYKEQLERDHRGKIALMSDGKLVELFNDKSDARTYGIAVCGDGKFSIVEIGVKPTRLAHHFVGTPA